MAHSPDHSLAPASAAPSGTPSAVPSGIPAGVPPPAAPAGVPSFLRPMSAVPVAELPPLKPLPTNDPYSPVAVGQALFCAVFNVTFSTLLAWLASIPQHLIQQVRQTFSSPSPSPAHSPSLSSSPSSLTLDLGHWTLDNPLSLSERILLACRSLYSLLRVYHTFSSYWDRVTPHQLGLLSRAAGAIKAFSGRSFDFSCWADLAGRPARSYFSSSSVAPSPDLPASPSSPVAPSPARPIAPASSSPFPEWPFTALTAYNASFTTAPGRLLAQVCHDLARLTQSPSPSPEGTAEGTVPPWTVPVSSELESPSPSPSCSLSIPSAPSDQPSSSTPSIPLSFSPAGSGIPCSQNPGFIKTPSIPEQPDSSRISLSSDISDISGTSDISGIPGTLDSS